MTITPITSIQTAADDRCLAYIRDFMEAEGYPPSMRQIGAYLGVRSPATVHQRIRRLEREGRLIAKRNSARTLTLEVVLNGDQT